MNHTTVKATVVDLPDDLLLAATKHGAASRTTLRALIERARGAGSATSDPAARPTQVVSVAASRNSKRPS